MNTEARFLHSLKAAQAIEVGAKVKEIWDNGQEGDQKVVIVEFENVNGVCVIDNADLQFADYSLQQAIEAFESGEIETSSVEEFRPDPDYPGSVLAISDVASYEAWRSK